MLELRQQIAKYQATRFGAEYDPTNEILVTVGASEGIDLALRALIEPGDEVLVPNPSYVSYAPGVAFSNGVCVTVPTSAKDQFRLTPEALKAAITPKTKALILPYPNNPTGGIMTKKDMEAIAAVLKDTDIVVISDEIYAELTYTDVPHVSFAAIDGMWELAHGLRLRAQGADGADVQDPPVHHALCPNCQPVCRAGGAQERL